MLAVIVSAFEILLTTFILISQNRLSDISAKRADLDVQIGLLTEREATRILEIVDAIAKHLEVPIRRAGDLDHLKKDTSAIKVIERIETESNRKGLKSTG